MTAPAAGGGEGSPPGFGTRFPFPRRARAVMALLGAALAMTGCGSDSASTTTLRFWAMGREGEMVQALIDEFERETPGVEVDVQQIPWTAAHEKLLTAFVGRATPDAAQLGNTWVAEFAALNALEPLGSWLDASAEISRRSYFPGIWETNVIDGAVLGVPWYVDTRVLFYRKDILAQAGYGAVPLTWSQWRKSLEAIKRVVGPDAYSILLPINEWPPPIVLGLQAGSPLLVDDATRGAFSGPEFRRAFAFYIDLFRSGLAPPVSNNEIANLYQEFARGYFAMYITGPWNLGEFRRRLPPELQDAWGTSALPGPDETGPGVSLAGGSSLVMFKGSKHKPEAWKLIEFLSRPAQQVRFYELTGDLPARREAWSDSALAADPNVHAFREQLERVTPTPKIPEWEQIAIRVQERVELAVRGRVPPDTVLAYIDRDVARFLEKRKWLLEKKGGIGSRDGEDGTDGEDGKP